MSSKGRIGLAIVAVAMSVAAGGCGTGSHEGPGGETLTGVTASFPDYLDPALSISREGAVAMWNTYLPLLTYRHAPGRAGSELIPALARSLPRVGADGRTYTLRLREGLRYSDGRAILASDFRHSLERALAMNSGGSPLFEDIVGVRRFMRTHRGGIRGIATDDRTGRITIHLREPSGIFVYALATLYAAPLPGDTPTEDLSADPPPASGPYEIVASEPGRAWEYARNPEWARVDGPAMPRLPAGHFDRIVMRVVRNPETQVNEVERGAADWVVNPPADRLGELRRRYAGGRLLVTPLVSDFYFWMNTTEPPFEDVRVRRAVNLAIDPAVPARIYGGLMAPLQQILPRGMPGHRTIHPYPHDMARARALVAAADPRERRVSVWTNSFPPDLEAGEYYEGVLRELGLDPTLKVISPANYFAVIGNGSNPDLDTGWGSWLLEYPHPASFFEGQLTRAGIRATNTTNWSRFVDPQLETRLQTLRREQLGPRQEAAYARLDREVMREAPLAPFGSLEETTFLSARIDPRAVIVSPVYGQDLTSFRPRGAAGRR